MPDGCSEIGGTAVQVLTLDCGQDRQLRWIWFAAYGPEPSRLVCLATRIPDLPEYMRYWRSVWHRESTEDHQSHKPDLSPRILTGGGGEDG